MKNKKSRAQKKAETAANGMHSKNNNPLGSYTGLTANSSKPVQDADDL